uniref:Uncharacterized protein n=1 Tax=Tanacetum cinerariifolium TaxID=118510 RepID=A0A699GTN0_TANCI|nr:hypothetical protein [Tanacetum cinerariifolium]
MTFVIQVLDRNKSSTDQLNSSQQMIVYSLLTGTKIDDIKEIIFNDLVIRLTDKPKKKYVAYPSISTSFSGKKQKKKKTHTVTKPKPKPQGPKASRAPPKETKGKKKPKTKKSSLDYEEDLHGFSDEDILGAGEDMDTDQPPNVISIRQLENTNRSQGQLPYLPITTLLHDRVHCSLVRRNSLGYDNWEKTRGAQGRATGWCTVCISNNLALLLTIVATPTLVGNFIIPCVVDGIAPKARQEISLENRMRGSVTGTNLLLTFGLSHRKQCSYKITEALLPFTGKRYPSKVWIHPILGTSIPSPRVDHEDGNSFILWGLAELVHYLAVIALALPCLIAFTKFSGAPDIGRGAVNVPFLDSITNISLEGFISGVKRPGLLSLGCFCYAHHFIHHLEDVFIEPLDQSRVNNVMHEPEDSHQFWCSFKQQSFIDETFHEGLCGLSFPLIHMVEI